MGCDSYSVGYSRRAGDWDQASIRISDVEDWTCLCTVRPDSHNTEPFTSEDIRTFAAVGALVVLAHHGDVESPDRYLFVPHDVPPAIIEAIQRFVPDVEGEQ